MSVGATSISKETFVLAASGLCALQSVLKVRSNTEGLVTLTHKEFAEISTGQLIFTAKQAEEIQEDGTDAKPTRTLVARLQGIETIREFLAGRLITLLLDLPFLFVFLGLVGRTRLRYAV